MKRILMIKLILLTSALSCSIAFAGEDLPIPDGMDFGEYLFLLSEGGYIDRPNSGKGQVLILNLQNKVAESELVKASENIRKDVNVKIVVDKFQKAAQITIKIVDDAANEEPLSIYPDNNKATVNVAALVKDSPASDILAGRARREVMRAFAILGGAAGGEAGLLMDAMTSYDRLDQAEERLPGDIVLKCDPFLKRIGIMKWARATYRKACEEGWAPKPANDFEKAVWEEVHSIPTNPMKIEFDPKKGR